MKKALHQCHFFLVAAFLPALELSGLNRQRVRRYSGIGSHLGDPAYARNPAVDVAPNLSPLYWNV